LLTYIGKAFKNGLPTRIIAEPITTPKATDYHSRLPRKRRPRRRRRRLGPVVRVLVLQSSSLPFDGFVLGVPPPPRFVNSTSQPPTSWDFYQISVQFSIFVW